MSMPGKGKHHLQGHHGQQQQHGLHHPQPLAVSSHYVQVSHNSPYNTIVAHGNEGFHIPGQNYGAQPGNQVGGGGNSVGVPGGRGPPPLSGIQSLGQTTTGIPPGGPGSGAQQAPPQPPTPGVQAQQQQGPNQTTTPPVHTSTAPDMGKQPHLSTQQNTLPPAYQQNQTRPVPQYYATGPRPQQQRGLQHRSQANAGATVVNMPVNNGQQAGMYPHPHMQPTIMFQSQVGLHHQQHQFPNQIQMQGMYGQHPRHQQSTPIFYPQFLLQSQPTQHQHPAFTYYPHNAATINIGRANPSSVSGGAQHSGSPLVGAQGTPITPQGPLQQAPQPMPMPMPTVPPMGAELYMSHNGGMTNMQNNLSKSQLIKKPSRAVEIIDPSTGKNILNDNDDNATTPGNSSSNRATSQPENGAVVRAMFAAQVAQRLTEPPETPSPPPPSTPTPTQLTIPVVEAAKSAPQDKPEEPKIEAVQPEPKDEEKKAHSPPRRKSQPQVAPPSTLKDDRKREDKARPEVAPPREHLGKANGEAEKDTETVWKSEKPVDGGKSAQQKQKNKSKVRRDLNRRGADKEGTDMDAFVASAKIDPEKVMPQMAPPQVLPSVKEPSIAQPAAELAEPPVTCTIVVKDLVKEPENNDAKIEKVTPEICGAEFDDKDKTPEIEDEVEKVPTPVSNEVPEKVNVDDVVDHAAVQESSPGELKTIVDKKNEENAKISERSLENTIEPESEGVTEEERDTEEAKAQAPAKPILKYMSYYTDDMWSPINQTGRKVYSRNFLFKLQHDPQSLRKPECLPDLEVVIKDSSKKNRTSIGMSSSAAHRSESFFPFGATTTMVKSNMPPSSKATMLKSKQHSMKKPMQLSISLREEVKLRESLNAWKPMRLKPTTTSEEDEKTEKLLKKVRSVLNKLTPENLNTLVKQVQRLDIDNLTRLEGVIKLVFEKAIEEPNFSETYAQFCKEVGNMQVVQDSQESSAANFRKLIITRCQMMFENHASEENITTQQLHKDIEACKDAEKKKELQLTLEEEKRRIRLKSVGNIRFIGEIFKLNMLTVKIMHTCIVHLLSNQNEENLECLCKLLTTIGENLEKKGQQNLGEYFENMEKISQQKSGKDKISSRIRFMLQDVIDLRKNKWVPRREHSNPKTMGEIKQDFINEKKIQQSNAFNNPPPMTPRKEDRGNDRKRNRMGPIEDGWTTPARNRQQPQINVETAKLKNKPPSMDDLQLGNRSTYMNLCNKTPQSNVKMMPSMMNKFSPLDNFPDQDKRMPPTMHFSGSRSTGQFKPEYKSNYERCNTRNGSYQMNSSSMTKENPHTYESGRSQSMSMPPPSIKLQSQSNSVPKIEISADQIAKLATDVAKKYSSTEDIEQIKAMIVDKIGSTNASIFVAELINFCLEKTASIRRMTSQLLCLLISSDCISLQQFKSALFENLSMIDDLHIDIPKVWDYFAEILCQPIIKQVFPLTDLKEVADSLRNRKSGSVSQFIGQLITEMSKEESPQQVQEMWSRSGIQWCDLGLSKDEVDIVVNDYKLEYLVNGKVVSSSTKPLESLNYIHDQLLKLMKERNFDKISNWITQHVGDRVKDPKFVRTLMTAILESSIEVSPNKCDFLVDAFTNLEKLIPRFVDTEPTLELQCLFAIQAYTWKIKHPQGLILKIFNKLLDDSVISNEAFLQWENDTNPAEQEGKGVAVKTTTSFFTALKETEDDDASDDEAPLKDEDMPSLDKDSETVKSTPAHSSSTLSQDCRG